MTEDRSQFRDWLLWNYDKQDHAERELVVIDSSPDPDPWPRRPDLRVVRCEPGTPVATKRNLALDHADGELVTWFDDDDWQHPRKLSLLAAALVTADLAGSSSAWFVDLERARARRHAGRRATVVFNSLGARRELARSVRFDERLARASDTPWLREVQRRAGTRTSTSHDQLVFWLCHDRNLSNPAGRGRPFTHELDTVRATIGAADWADTDDQLDQLRRRAHVARSAPSPAPAAAPPLAPTEPAPRTAPPPPAAPPPTRPAGVRAPPRLGIVITTYNRPDTLGLLLDDLEAQRGTNDLAVAIFDDASPGGYAGIRSRAAEQGWTYVRAERNHGKRDWWRWWNTILGHLRRIDVDRFVVLQDDLRLCDRFFDRVDDAWSAIRDPAKVSLFLHVDNYNAELGSARWTRVPEVRVDGQIRSGWVDLTAFTCERRFFEALGWQVEPRETRWDRDPTLGSGVGAQISARLLAQRLGMYRVSESLTVHGDTPSMMNPEARVRWPVRTERFVDGDAAASRLAGDRPRVLASLASVPARTAALERVVAALLPQVDRLAVYLNGYADVPAFLHHDRIEVATSQEHGDRGDAGKFFWAGTHAGYVATCDDDIAYPADYVARLVDGIERHHRRAVVGFHGATLVEPVADYYRSRHLLHFAHGLGRDTGVHVLGTGVAGFHTSALAVAPTDFPSADAADLHLAVLGQRRSVPFVCLAHEARWLRELPGTQAGSIYERRGRRGPVRDGAGAGVVEPSGPTALARQIEGWQVHPSTATPLAPPPRDPRPAPAPRPPRPSRPPPPTQPVTGMGAPTPAGPATAGLGRLVDVAVQGRRHRARIRLPEHDHITLAVQRTGTYYERDLLDRIQDLGIRGTYVDVGAHFGNHTLFFALECGADHVVAIEPNQPSLDGLRVTVAQNDVADRVTALGIAIHPTFEQVEVVGLPWSPGRRSRARTNSGRVGVRAGLGPDTVAARRLDDALDPFGPIALLKIDAEDLDVEILESGRATLTRHRPVVAVEAPTDPARDRVRDLLEPLDYVMVGQFCWTPTWLWVPRDHPSVAAGA